MTTLYLASHRFTRLLWCHLQLKGEPICLFLTFPYTIKLWNSSISIVFSNSYYLPFLKDRFSASFKTLRLFFPLLSLLFLLFEPSPTFHWHPGLKRISVHDQSLLHKKYICINTIHFLTCYHRNQLHNNKMFLTFCFHMKVKCHHKITYKKTFTYKPWKIWL